MPYEDIPHVGARFDDGSLRESVNTSQPRVLVLGSATSGLTNELFSISNVRAAETEFGAASAVLQGIHEVIPQGAQNLALMRVGGRQGQLTLTDSTTTGTLVVRPEFRDDTILDRYALAMTNTAGIQRTGVFDLIDEAWVHDSSELLVINQGIIDIDSTNFELQVTGSFTDPTTMTAMSALVVGDFTPSLTSISAVQGTDGVGRTLVEKYAALNTGYHLLDFEDADLITPRDVYVDDDNVADGDALSLHFGQPLTGEADSLGYAWQFIYYGKLYTYFTDSATYFTDVGTNVASVANPITASTLTITAVRAGDANGKFSITTTGGAADTASIAEVGGVIEITYDLDPGVTTTLVAATAINVALAAFTMSNGLTASDFLLAAGDGTAMAGAEAVALSVGGSGPFAVTHTDLTGDAVPTGVTDRLATAVDAELREVNFAHQLASFCRLASTTWKTMIGSIAFREPTALSRTDVAAWVGELPTYTFIGDDLAISVPASNGVGLLGNKFMAGKAITSDGYRAARVTDGNATNGLAYGGFIQTKGASLPNGSDWAYGIESNDELLDVNSAPVDLGKHLLVTYDWPVHRNAFNGATPYRGTLSAALLGKVAVTPINEEPIGINGAMLKVTTPPRIHSSQLNSLASIRTIGLRFEDGVGYILVSAKTAAHPDSDYSRLSTIRAVNNEIEGIRAIAKKFIGKSFSPTKLVSLQAQIDGFLVAERGRGNHQGAIASLSYTRSDKILGKLSIRLRMVPPFSIERIDIITSLAADESEL